jgi:hypothetical protein
VLPPLASSLQDRCVKVSLFLEDGIQGSDGAIACTHAGALPQGSERPGAVRYYRGGKLVDEVNVRLANADGVQFPVVDFDILSADARPCKLGGNMYLKKRPTKANAKTGAFDDTSAGSGASEGQPRREGADTADELNVLASMLGGARHTGDNTFTIVNLFPDTSLGSGGDSDTRPGEVLTFGSTGNTNDWEGELAQKVGDFGIDNNVGNDDDDLLALMDSEEI